ncbi:hypothetical protein LEMLEM_LOCUS2894 [Lemmus lemmus]
MGLGSGNTLVAGTCHSAELKCRIHSQQGRIPVYSEQHRYWPASERSQLLHCLPASCLLQAGNSLLL